MTQIWNRCVGFGLIKSARLSRRRAFFIWSNYHAESGDCGATGYTGSELVQWIQRHPELEVGWITSENSAGKRLPDVHPVPWDYPLIPLAEGFQRVGEVDVVFLCLPHGESIEAARRFAEAGVRVVDLSADFRFG